MRTRTRQELISILGKPQVSGWAPEVKGEQTTAHLYGIIDKPKSEQAKAWMLWDCFKLGDSTFQTMISHLSELQSAAEPDQGVIDAVHAASDSEFETHCEAIAEAPGAADRVVWQLYPCRKHRHLKQAEH